MADEVLQMPLQYLKGVGPRKAADLKKAGLNTVEDLLFRFPRRYEDRSRMQKIISLRPGMTAAISGTVLNAGLAHTRRPGFRLFSALVQDDSGQIQAVWPNQAFLKDVIKSQQRIVLFGKVEIWGSRGLQITDPEFEIVKDGDPGTGNGEPGTGEAGADSMAGVVDYTWKTDRFNYGGQYLEVGEKFNAEMGYVPRLDIRSGNVRGGWTPRPKFGGIRQLAFAGSANYYENHAGVVDSQQQAASATMFRQDTSSAFAAVVHEYDNLSTPFATAGTVLPVGNYSWTYAQASYSSDRTRRMYGSFGGDVGGYYNGDRQTVRANVTLQMGKTLLFEPNYTHNRVTLPGRPVYNSNVLNFRVSHSFSPDFYLKGFVQYNDDRNTANFNFLWWWHYKPGSDFYVVYNQGWETDLPLTSREAIDQSNRVRSRSLAVKMTYWLAR